MIACCLVIEKTTGYCISTSSLCPKTAGPPHFFVLPLGDPPQFTTDLSVRWPLNPSGSSGLPYLLGNPRHLMTSPMRFRVRILRRPSGFSTRFTYNDGGDALTPAAGRISHRGRTGVPVPVRL